MNRHSTPEWKELVNLQNRMPEQDILTITGFMDHEQFINHLNRYRDLLESK
jgi:hypothetical protein